MKKAHEDISGKSKKGIRSIFQWLTPGLGVKRWFVVLLGGTTLIGVGTAILLLDIYRTTPNTWWLPVINFLSLRFMTRPLRVLVFGTLGLGLIILGIWGLNRALLIPFLRPGQRLIDQVADYRNRGRGPRVVVIGGGHGLATVLRGMKQYTNNLTAVVSVADDGGSSGELRNKLGILPPGDIRNCLAALSDDEAMLTQLFQYRFGGESSLGGHTFGNLFISALVEITGSFENAITESGHVLSVHGRVLPATLQSLRLVADVKSSNSDTEVQVKGESKIPKMMGKIRRVWLDPTDVSAYPPVIQAILAADIIAIGPGSLYTSILPNILVKDLLNAIYSSRALKIFVTNITTEPGETENYSCGDHIYVIEELIGHELADVIVCNNHFEGKLSGKINWVKVNEKDKIDQRIYEKDLLDRENPMHHDAVKLAQVIMALYNERTGPVG